MSEKNIAKETLNALVDAGLMEETDIERLRSRLRKSELEISSLRDELRSAYRKLDSKWKSDEVSQRLASVVNLLLGNEDKEENG